MHLGANAHNAVFIQVFQFAFANIGNIVSRNFRTKFSVSHVYHKLVHVNA